ncbi:hypothetical protein CVIRNUC_007618 [Coccomyxa viridis]|uniref:SRPBCC family protein n=1 Tax=Coccomyxa viridis TaxID=1274662 RepID=A0AAV1IEI0_9CHLO|nr:hypothetical protein CVIRNUC_007618 [Coccomyxa viridis]
MAERHKRIVSYNGATYGRVSVHLSMVISAPVQKAWKVAAQFGNMAQWLGTVDGHQIHTQLLGGHLVDHIGAVRVVSIADKRIVEKLTVLDSQTMTMAWHIISHPLAINPFPASYLNCRTGFTIASVTIPGNQAFMDWKLTMLTELHAMDNMKAILGGMMRVGMLNIQKHFTRSELPPMQKKLLRLPNAPPILPPIAEGLHPPQNMPAIGSAFPRTAAPETSLDAVFMSAPLERQSMFNADSITNAATYMEMTVPLLHEAEAAGSHLFGQTDSQSSQAQCGAVSEHKAKVAHHRRSGPGASAKAQADAEPRPDSESMLRKDSAESAASSGSGGRVARRSASGGENSGSSSAAWQGAASLFMARSASQPLN